MRHVKKQDKGLCYEKQYRSHSGPGGRAGEANEKVKDLRSINEGGEVRARESILIDQKNKSLLSGLKLTWQTHSFCIRPSR